MILALKIFVGLALYLASAILLCKRLKAVSERYPEAGSPDA